MSTRMLIGPALLLLASSVAGQETLCNPCVDPGIRQVPAGPERNSTVITREDMRRLGVVSIADMIQQLPSRITGIQAEDAVPEGASTEASDSPPENPVGNDTRTTTENPAASASSASSASESAQAE